MHKINPLLMCICRLFCKCRANAANRADELNDDVDVLVVGKEISVVEWIEDQLLTALPFAPTHNACEMVPLLDNTPSNPFSVLKNL